MLTLDDIRYRYPGRREPALRGLSVRLADGVTVLAGPNAGGKTTLLRLLAGLLEPFAGVVTESDGGRSLAAPDLRRMARMVMQDADPQILGARVGEDILLGAAAAGTADFTDRARGLAARFGLDRLWDESVESLSYGQKRKLCLVHALAAQPRLLLLDEPFAGLDYPSARELRDFIREHRRDGLRQVVSTHELEPVYDLADRVIVVANGGTAAEGEPKALLDRLGEWSVRAPGKGWE